MIKRGKPTKNGQVKLTFTIAEGPARGGVSLVGDFNGWDPYAHPMQRKENGTYQVSLTVPARQPIRFRYLADGGVWFDDADADHHDEHGGRINPVDVQEAPEGITSAPSVGKPMRQTLTAGQPVTNSVSAS
ncbi:isoamylase early set domain-containing protein [Streptosporangium amethystogenes]|uniref:isoamylase early set domain-containing protein n=1 Tax=Streptosporangium amethystogenes TaxID=2002 RepID=UPI00068AF3CD|nr:isoamylase early set domain-containing protein [Streptosporangium amethystogenes]